MRKLMLSAGLFLIATAAQADPYPWCAQYGGGREGGASNCYFKTIQQCQAAVSGVGGFCRRNMFYDGKPVRTPEDSYGMERRRSRNSDRY